MHTLQLKAFEAFFFPPPPLLHPNTMVFTDALRALLDSSEVHPQVSKWLETEGLVSIEDFAHCSLDEASFEKEVVLCAEHGVTLRMKEKANLRNPFGAARKSLASTTAIVPAGAAAPKETFGPGVWERIVKVWMEKHNLHLPGSRLMTTKLLVRLHDGILKRPRQLEIISMDCIKLKSDLVVAEIKGTLVSGTSLTEVDSSSSMPDTRPGFWMKLRAYMTSVALVSCDDPTFYCFEVNEHFLEQIFAFIFLRHDREVPTMEAMMGAWVMQGSPLIEVRWVVTLT